MMGFRKTGGTVVEAGTYWNFETGKKVRMESKDSLPGSPSQSYYKLPPMLILAIAAAAAHVFLYILPKYLVQYYEVYTENLVTAYVILDYIAIGIVLIGMILAAIGDIFGLRSKVPAFTWRPDEAYLADKRLHRKDDQTSEDKAKSEKSKE